MDKKKQKKEFSKILCILSIGLLTFSCLVGMLFAFLQLNTEVFIYILSAAGVVTTGCLSFYFVKAKSENLSKQRIRFVVMKLFLESKLDPDSYQEVLAEIENIDMTINEKLNNMVAESIQTDEEAINGNGGGLDIDIEY